MKAIRQSAVTALQTALQIPVHDSKVTPTQLQNLPCCIVFNDSLGASTFGSKAGFSSFKDFAIKADIVVAQAQEDYADTLDDLVNEAIEILTASTFASNVICIEGYSVSYNYTSDFDKPLAIASVTISGKF